MIRHLKLAMGTAALLILVGCASVGGGGSADSWNPRLIGDIPIPEWKAGSDLINVDLAMVYGGRYYFTSRTGGIVYVIDTATNKLIKTIRGEGANEFSGCRGKDGAKSACTQSLGAKSGPNGINAITGTNKVYVPDVDDVKVIDTNTLTVIKTIKFLKISGTRADEGCFDPDHKIYMISSNNSPVKYVTFINTETDTAFLTVLSQGGAFEKAEGNEQCQYDPITKTFLMANGGTTANHRGEIDVIPVSSLLALAPGSSVNIGDLPGLQRWPLPACDPSGMDLGPGTDMIVECRPGGKAELLVSYIMNRTNGEIVATVNSGGADQVHYDSATNRYYLAAARWKNGGYTDVGGGCSEKYPCYPVVHVIDAATRTLVARLPMGNLGKSGVVDPVTGHLYVPYAASTTGTANSVVSPLFNGSAYGGVSVYNTR